MNHTMLESDIAIVDGERLKKLGVLVFEFANRHFECTKRMSQDTTMQTIDRKRNVNNGKETAKEMRITTMNEPWQ